jgi:hypothetical protein
LLDGRNEDNQRTDRGNYAWGPVKRPTKHSQFKYGSQHICHGLGEEFLIALGGVSPNKNCWIMKSDPDGYGGIAKNWKLVQGHTNDPENGIAVCYNP